MADKNIPGKMNIALVIDDELVLRATNEVFIRSYPDGAKVMGQWQDFNAGFAMLKECKPTIALIGVYSEENTGALLLAERVSAALPETHVFMISTDKKAETLLSAMRAGVKECLIAPIDTDELLNAVERVRKQVEIKKGGPSLIGVMSAKGGLGATTVAVNLAVALKYVTNQKVFLVDCHVSGGDVALFLNLQYHHTLKDVIENVSRLDSTLLSGYAVEHPSGIRVIPGMELQSHAGDFTERASALQHLFNFLRTESNYTVVDIGSVSSNNPPPETLKTLDSILLVLTLELAAIRDTKQAMIVLEELDLLKKTKLVVNRYDKRYAKGASVITPEDVVKTLNMPIFHTIPNDYIVISECINLGLPIVTEKRKSPISRSFVRLAELISTADVAGTPK